MTREMLQVATCVKSLHELYGDDFIQEVQRCMEADVAASSNEEVASMWAVLIQSVADEDIKGMKDAFKALMRLKQGVMSRISLTKCCR